MSPCARHARALMALVLLAAFALLARPHHFDRGPLDDCSLAGASAQDAPAPTQEPRRHHGVCCILHDTDFGAPPPTPALRRVDFPTPRRVAISTPAPSASRRDDPRGAPQSPRAPPVG